MVLNNGIARSATPPAVPIDGIRWYDSVSKAWMYYDAAMGYWLSEEVVTITLGDPGNLTQGVHALLNSVRTSPTSGFYAIRDFIVTDVSFTRVGLPGTFTAEIVADGNAIAEFSSGSNGDKFTINAIGNQDQILSIRNKVGSLTVIVASVFVLFLRWRMAPI